MQVSLKLKSWRAVEDEENKSTTIGGEYSVMLGDKELACQSFGPGYGKKKIPFSGDVLIAMMALEKMIIADLEKTFI